MPQLLDGECPELLETLPKLKTLLLFLWAGLGAVILDNTSILEETQSTGMDNIDPTDVVISREFAVSFLVLYAELLRADEVLRNKVL